MIDIVTGLHSFHSQGILHNDISLGNILMDKDGSLYLCMYFFFIFRINEILIYYSADFGFVKDTSLDKTTSETVGVGTPHFMPPEIIREEQFVE
jgi:serine/threonine protein kinase